MHADLSRDTFRAGRNYSMVLAQQGRVQLDADLNEQAAIQEHRLRTVAADLIGPDGGPRDDAGFAITHVPGEGGAPDDLAIGEGRYYVDGVLIDATRPVPAIAVPDEGAPPEPEDPRPWTWFTQPDGFRDQDRTGDRLPGVYPYLVYLKVWERAVTAVEEPSLREVALGPAMPDTAARIRVVWQVHTVPEAELGLSGDPGPDTVRAALADWASRDDEPRLAARARRPEDTTGDPCLIRPEARFRGRENQLYRVEIHDAGPAAVATFKWSRENGSVVFAVHDVDGAWVELDTLDKVQLSVGEWVEVVDTAYTSRQEPLPLLRVEEVDLPGGRVRLSAEPAAGVGRRPELRPYLRRWDHTAGSPDGVLRVEEGRWLPLEDGVEVYFAAGDFAYATGDSWLIPARTATGDVEWPRDPAGRPLLAEPSGGAVAHAPLAWVTGPGEQTDLRLLFDPLARAVRPAAEEGATKAARPAAKRRTRRTTGDSR
ncbi:hypothetical protein GCM10010112_24420 [Actinoplanes lobatus]|uniref:Uncharacterized protein n=1 Tax=Actinoplanes lobatus TaxID=113568 RepID=A0A7W7HJ46_9ACTN|nr:DUF6519 domain-containing protein [Actinoplanes lobatus]MBB4751484.1 hypothetical protein [Actinoplanes lobatus]GGN64328.1 hypothetical protein GCM10010112_24420 [Actinoplanes lobatus]GIE41093.1 hypothetical protein Alo02nite_39910 [Actinoplanes lobatus]